MALKKSIIRYLIQSKVLFQNSLLGDGVHFSKSEM